MRKGSTWQRKLHFRIVQVKTLTWTSRRQQQEFIFTLTKSGSFQLLTAQDFLPVYTNNIILHCYLEQYKISGVERKRLQRITNQLKKISSEISRKEDQIKFICSSRGQSTALWLKQIIKVSVYRIHLPSYQPVSRHPLFFMVFYVGYVVVFERENLITLH